MKTSIICLFAVFGFFNCSFSSADYEPKFQNDNLAVSPTPESVICSEENYKPKPETEINSMTPRQLVDEVIKVNIDSFDTYTQSADYQTLIEKRIRKAGVNALPILTDYINFYQPQSAVYCDRLRFSTVNRLSLDIDRFEFRLRGTPEGRSTIAAFELAIKRMKISGVDQKEIDYKQSDLDLLKGVTFVDDHIRDTFWVNKRIAISDSELLNFSNFLTERDPTYPSWSDTDFTKDYSRVNEAANPSQVYIFVKPERFYEAYSDFKKIKRK